MEETAQDRCVRLIAAYPGRTGRELDELDYAETGCRQMRRATPHLLKKGSIRRGPTKICSVTGLRAWTWLPKED